ncbi:MAG: enoyl-CoA hydratase-related protein [Thermaerobacter sp.]|nr:enoyl-CoA hydratase-related protein [Thermaerobacter sp.]
MSAVRVDRDGWVMTITITHPPVNAISPEVLEALGAAVVAAEDPAIRAVVVAGSDAVFAAGADLPAFVARGQTPVAAIHAGVALLDQLEALPKPVIAAVEGLCLGGGMELALAADLRVASPRARFAQPEVALGIIPGWNGTRRLPRLIGVGPALDLILTGDTIDGNRAYALGLVQRLAPEGEALATAQNVARQLAHHAPSALAHAKWLVRAWHEPGAADREAAASVQLLATPDAGEGMQAFLEKRRPRFGSGA